MKLVRADVVRVVDHRDGISVLGADGTARRFADDSAELIRAVFDFVHTPIDRDALRRGVAELAGIDAAVPEARVIDDAVDALVAAGALVEARAPRVEARGPSRGRIVLGIAGAVATLDTPVLVRLLLARGFEVEIAATPKALRFASAAGLEALTHRPVHHRVWERDDRQRVPHVTLAEWADLVLICPATATTISRIAGGDCSNLVSAVAITTRAPVVIVPSMNVAMFEAASVQRNLKHLRDDGMYLVQPAFGHEVAHAPGARRSMLGPAPPARAVVDVVELVMRTDARAERSPVLPTSALGWDALHGSIPPERLPWHTEGLDADLGELLDRVRAEAPVGAPRLLDLGAGAGTAAIAASERGFEVVASDISASALARGRQRAGEQAITWVIDDVRKSTLREPFDVILDRACLHCLAPEDWPAYAETVARLAAPNGWLLLKAHAPNGRSLGTHPPSREQLDALLAPAFELVEQRDSVLHGPVPSPPAAVTFLYRRRVD
jgi:SAM-dependent methyltransferase